VFLLLIGNCFIVSTWKILFLILLKSKVLYSQPFNISYQQLNLICKLLITGKKESKNCNMSCLMDTSSWQNAINRSVPENKRGKKNCSNGQKVCCSSYHSPHSEMIINREWEWSCQPVLLGFLSISFNGGGTSSQGTSSQLAMLQRFWAQGCDQVCLSWACNNNKWMMISTS